MELTGQARELFDLLYTTEFDETQLLSRLKNGDFSEEDVNLAAYEYVDNCIHHDIDIDTLDEKYSFGENIPGLESSHLLEAIRILLDFGLDPNCRADKELELCGNIMHQLYFVMNGYQSADALALMLEHGGDPNLVIEGERFFDDLCCDISWFLGGDIESRYIADAFMHFWMVIVGFGAKWGDGSEVVETYDDFKTSDFKDHRNYYCGFIHVENTEEPYNNTAVSFFDKRTNREVARY